MRLLPLLLLLTLLFAVPVRAQEGYPLPENLIVMSPANVAKVVRLAQIDGNNSNLTTLYPTVESVRFDGLGWYDLRTGEERAWNSGPPFFLEVSTDGRLFLYAVRLVDAPSTLVSVWSIDPSIGPRTLVDTWTQGWQAPMDLSDDGALLVITDCSTQTTCDEGEIDTLVIWDAQNDTELARWAFETSHLQALALSPDNAFLITSDDNGVWVWDFPSLPQENESALTAIGRIDYLDAPIYGARISFSPDGETMLIYGDDSSYLLETQTFLPADEPHSIALTDSSVSGRIRDGFFSPDSTLVLTYDEQDYSNRWLRLWDVATKTQVAYLSARSGVFSPDNSILATSLDNTVTLWDVNLLRNGIFQPLATLETGDINTAIGEIAFNPDGTLLFVTTPHSVSVWGIQ